MYESHLCSLLSALLEENLFPSLHSACRSLLLLPSDSQQQGILPSPPPSGNGTGSGTPNGTSDGRYVISGEDIDARSPLLLVHPLYQLLQAVLAIHPALPPAGASAATGDSVTSAPPPPPSALAPEIIDYCDVIRSSLSSSALHLVSIIPCSLTLIPCSLTPIPAL
jgi:hypothetical protein